jgi:hypothetical protein
LETLDRLDGVYITIGETGLFGKADKNGRGKRASKQNA